MTCQGCGGVVAYVCQQNHDIQVCIFCRPKLDFIQWIKKPIYESPFRAELREHARKFGRINCVGCDAPVFHGGDVCPFCRNDVLTWLFKNVPDSMNDNPFVYQLSQAFIEFSLWLNLTQPAAGKDWIGFHPRGEPMHRVTFKRLVNVEENSS